MERCATDSRLHGGGGHERSAELAVASHLFSSGPFALLAAVGVDEFERAEAG
jgi:hypothetical protein